MLTERSIQWLNSFLCVCVIIFQTLFYSVLLDGLEKVERDTQRYHYFNSPSRLNHNNLTNEVFKQCINYWLHNKLLKLFNDNVFLDHSNEESSLHFGVRVEGIDELMSNTKFSREELQRMYRGFKNVSTQACVFKFFLSSKFCFNSICFSVSDEAIKMKSLNIEIA